MNTADPCQVVRSSEKLLALLANRAVSKETIDKNLVIIEGNAKDVDAVQKTLLSEPGRVVDQIVFGIGLSPQPQISQKSIRNHCVPGGVPKFAPNPLKPTLDDPTVCQTAIAAVISSLKRINDGAGDDSVQKPVIIAISSTGVSSNRDIPVLMSLLYKGLEIPHADKRKMESLIEEAAAKQSIGEFVIVRPSLLTNGKALGESKVKVGWEKEDGTGAAIGFTISRADVGTFIFEKIIRSNADEFKGKKVSVTY
jgi:NAD(P)H-binding